MSDGRSLKIRIDKFLTTKMTTIDKIWQVLTTKWQQCRPMTTFFLRSIVVKCCRKFCHLWSSWRNFLPSCLFLDLTNYS